MKSQLDLGVLFTGKLDPSFDANIQKIKTALGSLAKSSGNVAQANTTQTKSWNSLSKATGSYISDVEKLISLQARWYGAKAILFAAVDVPMKLLKEGFDQMLRVDSAVAKLKRYDAMLGDFSESSKQAAKDVVELARALNLKYPIPFDDIIKAADRLRAAGVTIDTVKGVMESFVQFQTAWPEVEMEKFTNAVVGMMNTFRKTPGLKELTSDTERYRLVLDKLTVALGIGVIQPKDTTVVMQHFGQMAQSIGLSVDEMLALSVLVTNLGSKAGPAARALAGLATSLGQEDKIRLLEKIGINIDKNITLGKQFVPILEKLRDIVGTGEKGYSSGAQQLLGKIVSVERMKALLPVLRDLDTYKDLLGDLAQAEGSTKRSADEMSKSLDSQIEILKKWIAEIGSMPMNATGIGTFLQDLIFLLRGVAVAIAFVSKNIISALTEVEKLAAYIWAFGMALSDIVRGDFKGAADRFRLVWEGAFFKSEENAKRYRKTLEMLGIKTKYEEEPLKNMDTTYRSLLRVRTKIRDLEKETEGKGDSALITAKRKEIADFKKLEIEFSKQIGMKSLFAPKEGEVKGAPTIPGTEKYSSLIASEKAYLAKRLLEEDIFYKEKARKAKQGFETNKMSSEEYRKISLEDAKQEFVNKIKLIDISEKKIKDIYDRSIINAKDTETATAAKERKETDLEKTKLDRIRARFDLENTTNILIYQSEKEKIEERKKLREYAYNLEVNNIEKLKEKEIASNAEQERQIEYLYANNRISAERYYNLLKTYIDNNYLIEKEALDATTKAIQDKYDQEIKDAGKNELLIAQIERNKNLELEKAIKQGDKLLLDSTAKTTDMLRKQAENINAIYGSGGKTGVLAVFYKTIDNITNELDKMGTRWETLFKDIAEGMSQAFEDFFFDVMQLNFDDLGQVFLSFLSSIQRAMAKFLSDEITNAFLKFIRKAISSYGSGGGYTDLELAPVGHSGGTVGETSFPTRSVPSWLFNMAPRLHSGLGSDEFPAILQKGEHVIPKGGSVVPNVEINITNETGSQLDVGKDIKFDMDKMVIGIILKDVASNGSLGKLLRGK